MSLRDRTAPGRDDYPVGGPLYAARGETTSDQVRQHVEAIIKTQVPNAVEIPEHGRFENCLDCAKHGFEALANAGYISHDTLHKFNVFYNGNSARVRATTDAHSRKELDKMLGGESSGSGSESSSHRGSSSHSSSSHGHQ